MTDILFLLTIGALLSLLLGWGFRHLPDERWQMLAVVPQRKTGDQFWQGMNLTYYGFFIATSQLLSLLLLLVLLGAMEISLPGTILATAMVLIVAVPAARIIAILVERKRHTFTIGGASFAGMIVAPFAIMATRVILSGYSECYLPLVPVMAAMAIAYTLGEGLGRLGCLSFGCCYGKPLKDCHPMVRKLFARCGTVFSGNIKKAGYESHLCGEPLVPVQAITCILFSVTAIVGCYLFLQSMFTAALISCIVISQSWRVISETMRADFRGFGKISAYQKMSAVAILYIIGVAALPHADLLKTPQIVHGVSQLWNPGIVISLQVAWLAFFLFFGRSTVTSATVSFTLLKDRV